VVDSDLGSALPAETAGGDMEQPVAQRLRLGLGQLTAQQGGVGPRDQIRGGQGQLQPDLVDLNSRDGNRPRPACLMVLIVSSIRA
jgi:hypothetical protein